MSKTLWQVIGMILLVVGGQGAVRMLIDRDDAGLLGWVPGGFAVQLGCQIAVTVAGVLLAGWATRTGKAAEAGDPGKAAEAGGRGQISDPGPSHR